MGPREGADRERDALGETSKDAATTQSDANRTEVHRCAGAARADGHICQSHAYAVEPLSISCICCPPNFSPTVHYVLDRWFTQQMLPRLAGQAALFRYADDFVICTQNPEEACWLLQAIRDRFMRCGLVVSEEKTRLLLVGRKAWACWRAGGAKPGTFDFLGFTHFAGTSRKGTYKVGRVTSRKKFRKSLQALKAWLKEVRNLPVRDWWWLLAAKLRGHMQYYGVSGNFPALARYYTRALQFVVRALARRSQKSGNLWPWVHRYLTRFPLPRPKIMHAWYAATPVK